MNQAFDSLLLHPVTRRQLGELITKPPHALMLTGPEGTGKHYLARQISSSLLGCTLEKLPDQPYYREISRPAGKSEIPIDEIRRLNSFFSLKVPGDNTGTRRVVLIKDAQFLSGEAQNALLKLLEEPPPASSLILTARSADSLLPTVASRAQELKVLPPSLTDAQNFYGPRYPASQLHGGWLLANGAVGLLDALLRQDDSHPLKIAVEQAKQFLTQDAYHKLLTLNKLTADKETFGQWLEALARVLASLHHGAVSKNNNRQAQKLLQSRQAVERSSQLLEQNVLLRLISIHLVLKINL